MFDFAKNRQIKYQDEIKFVFYAQKQITMHPIVTYYRGETDVVREASIVISEDNVHDYHAENQYQKIVEKHIGKSGN